MDLDGRWAATMRATNADYRVGGIIAIAGYGGTANLEDTTVEGNVEPIRFALDSVQTRGDSVFTSFAPIGFLLRGRCKSHDVVEGSFTVSQSPPFDSLRGVWSFRRTK